MISEQLQKLEARQQLYREREQRFSEQARQLGARSRLFSNLRGLSFAVLVVLTIVAFVQGQFLPAGPIALLALLTFAALIFGHARVLSEEDDKRRRARVNQDALARVSATWASLPENGARFASEQHPYAGDLDVFGDNSLFQRINVAHTRYGQLRLADFLRNPAAPNAIRERQRAVRALSDELELRQELEALSLAVVERPTDEQNKKQPGLSEPPDPEPLLRWAESEPELSSDALM